MRDNSRWRSRSRYVAHTESGALQCRSRSCGYLSARPRAGPCSAGLDLAQGRAAALDSPESRAAGDDVMSFAGDLITLMMADVEDDARR